MIPIDHHGGSGTRLFVAVIVSFGTLIVAVVVSIIPYQLCL